MSSGGCSRLLTMASDAWAEIVVSADGQEVTIGRVVGPRPDMATVDALARLQLAAARLGCTVQLRTLRPELAELVELAGLQRLFVPGVEPGG